MSLSLSPSATEHIKKIGNWFISAEVVKEEKVLNMYKCTDKGRYTMVTPLLEELGLQNCGFVLLRISGPVSIKKEVGSDTLFYPLTQIELNGEVLKPGNYMRFNRTQDLNANLDFFGCWCAGGYSRI